MRIGRIYKIVSGKSNECYVGSTFDELRYRFRTHKQNYKSWKNGIYHKTSLFDLFEKYGLQSMKIILIKSYEVIDKYHLRAYEQLWINNTKCVNQYNTFMINPIYKFDQKIKQKQYYEIYKEEKIKYSKKRYDEHKDSINIKNKIYREKNKQYYIEYFLKYYEKNKNKILEKNSEKITCEICSCQIRRNFKSRHEKSKKHKDNLTNREQQQQ